MQQDWRGGGYDKASVLANVCEALSRGRQDEAAEIVERDYPFAPVAATKRRYTETQCMRVFVRDGFIDRYSGQRLVFPGALRLISLMLPTQVPFHNNWKIDACHPAFWDLFPTIDHIVPVAHGGEDAPQNWVTTSMVRNSAKANFTLDQLGWALHPPGNGLEWDGLTGWFLDLVEKNEVFLASLYLRKWRAAAEAVRDDPGAFQAARGTTPLARLAAFLPIFNAPGFEFARYVIGPATFPFYEYSQPAKELTKTCYDDGWVRSDFDWTEWKDTPEAVDLRDSPVTMARATPDQLAKLLTVIARQEKFCNGAMADAFDSGLITAILQRAVVLLSEG
jgi:hypothetical protein